MPKFKTNMTLLQQKEAMKLSDKVYEKLKTYFQQDEEEAEKKALDELMQSWKEFCEMTIENPEPELLDMNRIGTDKMGEVLRDFFGRTLKLNTL